MSANFTVATEVVALAGDWHGNLGWAQRILSIAHGAGTRTVLQLGDFGYWRADPATRKYLSRLERMLGEREMQLLWIDGNHEDHARLASLPLADDGTQPISDHITHLPRGFRWKWLDGDGRRYTWLALGGAVSVDRQWRTAGRSWWSEEQISRDDADVAIAGGPVDVMVSHDAPAGVTIPGIGATDWPADVLRDADAHRALLREVVDAVQPHHLWHGHYHVRYDALLEVAGADEPRICYVHGLDRDDSGPSLNLEFVDASGQRAFSPH